MDKYPCISGEKYNIVGKSAYNLFSLVSILKAFTEQKGITSDDISAIDYVVGMLDKELSNILKCL